MLSTFETRFSTLLKKLKRPQLRQRGSGIHPVRDLWVASNEEHASPSSVLEYLRSRRFCAEHGWQGLSTGVCYVDNSESPDTRLYLHQDGSIVIQRLAGRSTILFPSPGAAKAEQAAPVHADTSHDIGH
jgi:hypothetical protein